MTEQNVRQNNVLANVRIQTDIALWKLLLQGSKKSHKMSRVEAFYDLIDRHCIAVLKGEDGHINGTVHNMAKTWGWDRETVAKFLDNLEQLGAVTIDMDGHRKTIRVNCVKTVTNSGASQKPSDVIFPSSSTNGT